VIEAGVFSATSQLKSCKPGGGPRRPMTRYMLHQLLSLAVALASIATAQTDCLQPSLRYGCDAYRSQYAWVCCANQHWAEDKHFHQTVHFGPGLQKTRDDTGVTEFTFYDAKCGIPLYVAPRGRSFQAFMEETNNHGWPSFRDQEVVTANVLTQHGNELVSTCGTHLGHNLPDHHGNRHCINLICMAGSPQVNHTNHQSLLHNTLQTTTTISVTPTLSPTSLGTISTKGSPLLMIVILLMEPWI